MDFRRILTGFIIIMIMVCCVSCDTPVEEKNITFQDGVISIKGDGMSAPFVVDSKSISIKVGKKVTNLSVDPVKSQFDKTGLTAAWDVDDRKVTLNITPKDGVYGISLACDKSDDITGSKTCHGTRLFI